MRIYCAIFIILTILIKSLAGSLLKPPRPRIIGGQNVTIKDYPYQVSIRVNSTHHCGGSIINERYILTAAHCLAGFNIEELSIRAGSSMVDTGGILRNITDIFPHPDYNFVTHDFDIGLVEIADLLPLNNKAIAPIKLPEQNIGNNSVDNMTGQATGWGRLSQGSQSSRQLQMLELPTLTQNICELVYNQGNINDRMFCAGIYEGGKDTCQGDSGGPFAVDGVIEGITSWGDGCGEENSPGVYTRVSWFVDYIDAIILN